MKENPITMLTDTLAEMTARALEAEEASRREDEWYQNYKLAADKCKELQAKMDAETELRESAQQALREEKEAHAETWRKVEELIVRAVDAGINRESLERLIYGEEITEGGGGDA